MTTNHVKPETIQTAKQLGDAVRTHLIRCDAAGNYKMPDAGFCHEGKVIDTNPDMVGFEVRYGYHTDSPILTTTGRRCWSYAGVGNCYETLNPDGTVHGWWSTQWIKPAHPQPTVREINKHIGPAGTGSCYLTMTKQDGLPGGEKIRIIKARTRDYVKEGKALASGKWVLISHTAKVELL